MGKGKNDDTLIRVRKGDLSGKGELVVGHPQINFLRKWLTYRADDIWEAGICHLWAPHVIILIENKDTHVPRAGRDLIRSVLEDANVPVSVRLLMIFDC